MEKFLPAGAGLSFTELRFSYRFRRPLRLDFFPGPEIRGSIGRQLKEFSGCNGHRDEDCRVCPPPTRADCLYQVFFEHHGNRRKNLILRLPAPLQGQSLKLFPGEFLEFDLLLVGSGSDYASSLLAALSQTRLRLGSRGVSPELLACGELDDAGSLRPYPGFSPGPARPFRPLTETKGSGVEFEFLTPTFLTFKHGRLLNDPQLLDFRLLVVRLVQGLRDFVVDAAAFQGRDPATKRSLEELYQAAGAVALVDHQAVCRPVRMRRPGKPALPGLTGRLAYHGPLTDFVTLLQAAEKFGLGKSRNLGFGQVSCRWL